MPHGGVFVLPIPNAVLHLGGYVAALLAGTAVTALALRLVKRSAVATAWRERWYLRPDLNRRPRHYECLAAASKHLQIRSIFRCGSAL